MMTKTAFLLLCATLQIHTALSLNCGGTVSGDSGWWYCKNRLGFPSYEDLHVITLTEPTKVKIDSCNSEFDTVLYIYDLELKYQYAMANDGPTCGAQAVLEAFLDPGQYYIVLEGTDRNGGLYELNVGCEEAKCQAPNIPNSNAGFACDGTLPGNQCNFECDERYESTDGTAISCNLGGVWNDLPSCVGVVCEDPPFIPNSNSGDCSTRSAGEYCTFSCDAGYRPANGALPLAKCGEDGQWEDIPVCEPVPSCDAPVISFSQAALCGGTPEQEVCRFYCEQGYVLGEGQSNVIYCAEGGDWEWQTSSSVVQPRCEPVVMCGSLVIQHVSNSAYCDDTPAGFPCNFQCDEGYAVEGDKNPTITCREDGTWDYGAAPSCTEALSAAPIIDEDGDGVDDVTEKMSLEFQRQYISQICAAMYNGQPEKCDDIEFQISGGGVPYDWEYYEIIEFECVDSLPASACQTIKDKDLCFTVEEECTLTCDVCDKFDVPEVKGWVKKDKFQQLNVQPHHKQPNTQFFDAYKFTVQQALRMGPDVNDSIIDDLRAEVQEVSAQMVKFLNDEEITYKALCGFFPQYECPSGSDVSSVQEDFNTYLRDFGLWDTFMSYSQEIEDLNARIDELLNTPVGQLRQPLADLENDGLHTVTTLTGETYPTWINTPDPQQVMQDFASENIGSVDLYVSVNTQSQFTTNYTETSAQSFVAKNAGSYHYMRFEEDSMDFKLNFTMNKWARVSVQPGEWYGSTWQALAVQQGDYFNSEQYDVEQTPASDKAYVYGDNGIMNSMVRELIVASDVTIEASFKMSMSQEEIRIWNNAGTSVQLPGLCTNNGQACVTYGTVFIGGDAPQYGGIVDSETIGGWKFMEHVVSTFMNVLPVGEEKYKDLIVGLGTDCSPNPRVIADDAGNAIHHIAKILDLNATCYDNPEGIERFFTEYTADRITPRMIYLPGSGTNGLSDEEGEMLRRYASTINEYVEFGGGLMAFGSGPAAFGWLYQLLPDLEEKFDCDITEADHTPQTSQRIGGLTKDLIRESAGCSSHFSGVSEAFGGLDAIATDTNEKPFMFSGLHIVDSTGEATISSGSTQSYIRTDPDDPSRLIMTARIKRDSPQIIAKYAPRFHPLL